MDAKAKNKALFRAKLNAQKKEKRINSPLVRYNDFDQPVCKICDCVLRSESVWDAHQLSRKHKEAIINLRAAAGGVNRVNSATTEAHPELSKPNDGHSLELEDPKPELLRPQTSSGLPPGFFDNQPQKQSTGSDSYSSVETDSYKRMQNRSIEPSGDFTPAASQSASSQAKQTKGALPEGFFDNKEADLFARGIKIVKPDAKDEYKEFEKLIQEDLKGVDNRLEEEENSYHYFVTTIGLRIDAAEMIEEAESVEQKTYREKVKLMRKKRMELKAANVAKRRKASDFVKKEELSHEESSSDGDSGENFAVDWRAQHL